MFCTSTVNISKQPANITLVFLKVKSRTTFSLQPASYHFDKLDGFSVVKVVSSTCLKPGVHTNDFAPIYGRRAKKLGHASLATVFRHGRLTFQPILWENLDSPVLRYQPITTAVITDACLNARWHHGAYTSAVLREPLGRDRVVTVYVVQSAQ